MTAVCLLVMSGMAWGQAKPTIPPLAGFIRVEEGVKNLEKRFDDMNKRIDDLRTEMNGRFSDLNGRIDELRTTVLTGFGVLFAGMFALIGFVIWDRRTAIAPVARTTKELEQREEKIVAALREYAKEDPKLLEIMKRIGIL